MPLPYPTAEANSKARAKQLLSAYPSAGMDMPTPAPTPSGQRSLPPPPMPKRGLGSADGSKSAARMDRAPRAKGGRAKATKVNVIVNAAPAAQPPTAPMLADGPPPGLIPPGPAPSPPMMPPKPMGPMAGGPPPGMPMPMRARGGKVYTAGAGSGPGREEKIKNYGDNAYIKDPGRVVKGVKGDADGRGN